MEVVDRELTWVDDAGPWGSWWHISWMCIGLCCRDSIDLQWKNFIINICSQPGPCLEREAKKKWLCNRHTKHQGNAKYSLILLIFFDDAYKLALNIILINNNEKNFLRHSVTGYDSTTYHFYTVKWPCQYWFYMKLQRDNNNNSDIDENWNHNI